MSTAGKVKMFSNIIELAINNKSKTETSNWSLYGTSIKAKWYALKQYKIFTPISYILSTIFGAIIGHYISFFLS